MQLGLSRCGAQPNVLRAHTDGRASFVLLANVADAGRVVADEHRREPRDQARLAQARHAPRDIHHHSFSNRQTFEQLCRHGNLQEKREAQTRGSKSRCFPVVTPTFKASVTATANV